MRSTKLFNTLSCHCLYFVKLVKNTIYCNNFKTCFNSFDFVFTVKKAYVSYLFQVNKITFSVLFIES